MALAATVADARDQIFNRIVVMIDASGSYHGQQVAALQRTEALLSELAARRVRRWEHADEVVVISLDAMPEVIWRGSAKEIGGMGEAAWARRFRARTDYAACTDVGAGFNLAGRLLTAEPRPTEKYLVVFSDLKDEPPASSPRVCRPVKSPSLPPQDMPWDALADTSVTVLWMPAEQKLAWKQAVTKAGLADNFAFYSISESRVAPLNPPPPAVRKISEAEKLQVKTSVAETGSGLLKLAGYFGLGLLFIVVLMTVAGVLGRRRIPTPGAGPQRPAGGMPASGQLREPQRYPPGARRGASNAPGRN